MKNRKLILSITMVLMGAFLLSGCVNAKEESIKLEKQISPEVEIPIPELVGIPEGVKEATLESEINKIIAGKPEYYSIGIKDLTTGNTVYINDTQLKSASIIKVFVAHSVYRLASEGKLDLNKELTLTQAVKCGGTGTLQGQKTGNKYTVERLVELMITISDNTASNMLLHEIGIEYVGQCIKDLGCKDTELGWYFVIPGPKGVRNLTSVRDLNMLFEKLYTNTCLGEEYDQKLLGHMKNNTNRTKLALSLPKETVVAHKTGAISSHEHDGGIVYGPKTDFIITIMTKGSNGSGVKKNMGAITKAAYDFYNK